MKRFIASCTIVLVLFQAKSQVVEEVSLFFPVFYTGSAEINNKLIYYGGTATQSGLVITDGTESGTELLDIPFIPNTSIYHLTNFNGNVYFSATGTGGTEIWVTDGTEAGTYMLKDIHPSGSSFPSNFIVFNGELYFTANDGANGRELWKTNGSVIGTVLVKDIYSGSETSNPSNLTLFNNALYFRATTDLGAELWKTDGTTNGTVLVKDINPFGSSDLNNFKVSDGKLFFSAKTDDFGKELYWSDGTEAGTEIIADINQGVSNSNPSSFFSHNNNLYFTADNSTNGNELWWYNSVTEQVSLLYDFNLLHSSNALPLEVLNNKLFVTAYEENLTYIHLFTVDLSSGNAEEFTDFSVGVSVDGYLMFPKILNNKLYFCGDDGTFGRELWVTDGTLAGTHKVTPANSLNADPLLYTENLVPYNSALYFIANYSSNGFVLAKVYEPSSVGINELDLTLLNVHPNPATTQITIDSPSSQKIEIYDVIGNLVTTQSVAIGKTTIDVSNFDSGIYFVRGQHHQNAVKIFINK